MIRDKMRWNSVTTYVQAEETFFGISNVNYVHIMNRCLAVRSCKSRLTENSCCELSLPVRSSIEEDFISPRPTSNNSIFCGSTIYGLDLPTDIFIPIHSNASQSSVVRVIKWIRLAANLFITKWKVSEIKFSLAFR